MSDRPYDHLMLYHGMPFDLKVRRLKIEERWVFVVALCLASQAPGDDRGSLVVASAEKIDDAEIAEAAEVDVEVVEETIGKLSDLGILVEIDEATGAMRFATWDRHNRKRKPSDELEAQNERQRRKRAKDAARKRDERAARAKAEEEGRLAQLVMDDDSAAPIRALADDEPDPLLVACRSCLVQPGMPCVTRDGYERQTVHKQRKRDAAAPPVNESASFFRSDRGGELARPLTAELPAADAEMWERIAGALAKAGHRYHDYLELAGREPGVLYFRAPEFLIRLLSSDTEPFAKVASVVLGEEVRVEIVDAEWRPAERAA